MIVITRSVTRVAATAAQPFYSVPADSRSPAAIISRPRADCGAAPPADRGRGRGGPPAEGGQGGGKRAAGGVARAVLPRWSRPVTGRPHLPSVAAGEGRDGTKRAV